MSKVKIRPQSSSSLQNAWLVRSGAVLAAFVGLAISVLGNQVALRFVSQHSAWIGPVILSLGVIFFLLKIR